MLGQPFPPSSGITDKKVKFMNRPTEYGMSRDGHQAVLTFFSRWRILSRWQDGPIYLSTFGPTYYVDMSYAKESDVTLPTTLQKSCKLAVHTQNPAKRRSTSPNLSG